MAAPAGFAFEAPPPAAVVIPPYRESRNGPTWTAAERNVRPFVQIAPQEAPEPIRDGATPARRAQVQVATFRYDMGQAVGTEDFVAGDLEWRSSRQSLPGQMQPWVERANTAPPQHVAYGSLFQYDPYVYGY